MKHGVRTASVKQLSHFRRFTRRQLTRIADCIRRLTDTDRQDPEIRDAEILYYYAAARDHWDKGRQSNSVDYFVGAAELVEETAQVELGIAV